MNISKIAKSIVKTAIKTVTSIASYCEERIVTAAVTTTTAIVAAGIHETPFSDLLHLGLVGSIGSSNEMIEQVRNIITLAFIGGFCIYAAFYMLTDSMVLATSLSFVTVVYFTLWGYTLIDRVTSISDAHLLEAILNYAIIGWLIPFILYPVLGTLKFLVKVFFDLAGYTVYAIICWLNEETV